MGGVSRQLSGPRSAGCIPNDSAMDPQKAKGLALGPSEVPLFQSLALGTRKKPFSLSEPRFSHQ